MPTTDLPGILPSPTTAYHRPIAAFHDSGFSAKMARAPRRAQTRSSLRQRNRKLYHVSESSWSDARIGLDRVLARLRLTSGPSRPLTGTRPLASSSLQNYNKHYRGLRFFCCLVGDYESLLLLQNDAPEDFCPSMSAMTVSNFIRFKKGTVDTELLDANGVSVHDRDGLSVYCQGGWNDPDNVAQFLSAVSNLHAARDQRGQYFESCKLCWDRYTNDQSSNGCFHHVGKPRLWRCGNPSCSELVDNTRRSSNRESMNYEKKGNFALMIDEIYTIRQRLISSGSLYDYQIWVMILIGVHLFLRSDELENMQLNHFLVNLTAKDDLGRVDQLVVSVQGKTEKAQVQAPVNLVLYRLDSHPQLCPIRALFLLLARTSITTGFVFGPKADVNEIESGSLQEEFGTKAVANEFETGSLQTEFYRTHVTYDEFNSVFFELCEAVTGGGNRGRYGTHTIRKTAYFYAIWGGGDLDHIRQAARHKTIKNAQFYYRDSKALLARARRLKSHMLTLSPSWDPIYLENLQGARRIAVDGPCPPDVRLLPTLAREYFTILGVDPKSTPLVQLICLIERDIPKKTAFDRLEGFLQTELPQHKDAVIALVNEIVYQRTDQSQQLVDATSDSGITPITSTNSTAAVFCTEATMDVEQPGLISSQRRNKRGGTNDIVSRKDLGKLKSTEEKIQLLLKIETNLPTSMTELTEGARAFVNQVLRPFLRCLREHFRNDVSAFTSKWGANVSHSRFGKGCRCAL